jgi:hypothetical protein
LLKNYRRNLSILFGIRLQTSSIRKRRHHNREICTFYNFNISAASITGRVFLFAVDDMDSSFALGLEETLGDFVGRWIGTEVQPSEFVYFAGPLTPLGGVTLSDNVPDGTGVMTLIPIHCADWLLGSGLIGLVAIRRQFKAQS